MKKQFFISFSSVLFVLLGFWACSSKSTDDPSTIIPTTGLAVTMTTSTTGGGYSPRNVVAVWVETNTGVFVKSLTVKAQERKNDLTKWNSSSAGNTTDAVTGATLSNYGTITSYWNGKDKNGTIVADGTYKVCMEITDKSATGRFASFTFTKGAAAETLNPANQPSFSAVTLKWTPL